MNSLNSLIFHLKQTGVLKTPRVVKAFMDINRKDFIPQRLLKLAYKDEPLEIGEGQTISQPYTVAFMLELLHPKKGDKILDVGSGSGYTTALLADIVGSTGVIIGVEIIPKLVSFGKRNLEKYGFPNAHIYQAQEGVLGKPEHAPYDKILVSASSGELITALVDQMKCGGRMVVPVGDAIWKVDKLRDDTLEVEKHEGFKFVPLITPYGHPMTT